MHTQKSTLRNVKPLANMKTSTDQMMIMISGADGEYEFTHLLIFIDIQQTCAAVPGKQSSLLHADCEVDIGTQASFVLQGQRAQTDTDSSQPPACKQ